METKCGKAAISFALPDTTDRTNTSAAGCCWFSIGIWGDCRAVNTCRSCGSTNQNSKRSICGSQ